jgi:hypothetical protein
MFRVPYWASLRDFRFYPLRVVSGSLQFQAEFYKPAFVFFSINVDLM